MRLVIAILVIAVAAAAAPQGYQEVINTECWECHSPGKDDRPMTPAFAVDPGHTTLDGETTMTPAIVNTWYAELWEMSLEVDLTDAPSISFTGGQDPIHNATTGTVTMEASPMAPIRQHSSEVSIEVPPGASALLLRLVPDDTSPVGPDLAMSVTDALSSRPFAEVDTASAGEPERLLLTDPGEIAGHGSGGWTITVTMQPVRDARIDPNTRAGFTVELDAWFNTSLERVLILEADGPVYHSNAQPFQVPIVADDAKPGESVTFTSRLRIFYEHGDSTPDEAWIVITETFVIGEQDGEPVLGTQALVIPEPPSVFALDSVAEAIGYGAAFLLVASILSGGILGKGSRRSLNRVFGTARRRVAFHNFLSYGILAAAFGHLILFLVEIEWHWAWGLLWGGLGILSLFALGFTGALQVPIVRRWGFASWRWIHFGMAIAAILFTIVHILLDGSHFDVRDTIGWEDPLVPDARQ